jgi:uncharacterized membrane protein
MNQQGDCAVESHYRSVAKTISWRVFGTLITGIVVWAITGKAGVGAIVSMIDTIIKLGVYYAHERAWNRVRLGRAQPQECET